MKTYFLDTNCILRFLLQDVMQQYKETKDIIVQAKKNKICLVISGLVIAEIIYALEKFYGFSKATTVDVVLSVVSASYIHVEDKDVYVSALLLYAKENIDFVDCYLLTKTKSEIGYLFTFDKKLKKMSTT